MTSPRETNDALRLSYCTQCEYSLQGLPRDGRCPECGTPYDDTMIELRGWGAGKRRTIRNARSLLFPALGLLLVIASQSFLFFTIVRRNAIILYVILIGIVVLIVSVIRRRAISRVGHAPTSVRISPNGYGQRDGSGEMTLHAWSGRTYTQLYRLRPGWCRIQLASRHPTFANSTKPTVDCEFELSEDAMELLGGRIESHLSRAREAKQ